MEALTSRNLANPVLNGKTSLVRAKGASTKFTPQKISQNYPAVTDTVGTRLIRKITQTHWKTGPGALSLAKMESNLKLVM